MLKDPMLKTVFDQGKLKGKLGQKKAAPEGKVNAMHRRLAKTPGPAEQSSPVAKAAVAKEKPAAPVVEEKSSGVDEDLVAKMKALKGK